MSPHAFAKTVGLLLGLLLCAAAGAFTLEEYTFEDPARQEAFRDLISKTRCLVCQNESLAGSKADLAQDLRDEIYRLMQEGRSREDVVEFLVERYGDFVLYEPPLKLATIPLWLGPLLLALIGIIVLRRAIISKAQAPEEDLSPEEQARLKDLLARRQGPQDPQQ